MYATAEIPVDSAIAEKKQNYQERGDMLQHDIALVCIVAQDGHFLCVTFLY